jgi:hypothetical protein
MRYGGNVNWLQWRITDLKKRPQRIPQPQFLDTHASADIFRLFDTIAELLAFLTKRPY